MLQKKFANKLANMVKNYKNMRETANHTRFNIEETKHK